MLVIALPPSHPKLNRFRSFQYWNLWFWRSPIFRNPQSNEPQRYHGWSGPQRLLGGPLRDPHLGQLQALANHSLVHIVAKINLYIYIYLYICYNHMYIYMNIYIYMNVYEYVMNKKRTSSVNWKNGHALKRLLRCADSVAEKILVSWAQWIPDNLRIW